ncbi:hypothetical protein GGI07_000357 [Coemansia sp. Benny D115]|nr:hypothetical protein GGI07_000357 [Coemansia sp. Benny D115]
MATPEAPLREILKSISFTQFPLWHIPAFYKPEPINRPQLHIQRPLTHKSGGSQTSDVQCLRTLALLRFLGYEFDVRYSSEPEASPNSRLPFLLLPDSKAIDVDHIEQHLTSQGLLSEPENADELAFQILVERNLVPAVEYLAWIDPVGFEAIAWDKYLGSYPPLIRYFLGWQRSFEKARCLRTGLPEYGSALDGDVLYDNAFRTLDALLLLLGTSDFFSGEKPGALDASVFACLNIILEAPLKSPIRTALTLEGSKYKPLVNYTMRILDKYFI